MTDPTTSVADYYDRNTEPFLRVGGSGFLVAAIHRQIWAPGVRTEVESFEYLNQLIAEALDLRGRASLRDARDPEGLKILDLGCGVGGTATWLAQRVNVHVTGVTISAVQARLAGQRAAQLGVAAQCAFVHGDMLHLPDDLGPFAAAYAIESFIHAEDPAQFFREAARVLAPGGRLIVYDDFLSHPHPPSEQAARTLALFRAGWHVRTLLPVVEAQRLAGAAGLRLAEDRDLTPHIRTVHPLIVEPGGWLLKLPLLRGVYWESLRGSTALQKCIRQGWTQYHALVWEKP